MYGEDYNTAMDFANRVYSEFSSVIKSVVFFGSAAKKKEAPGDIDILIIFDDASVVSDVNFRNYFLKEVNEIVLKTSERLHVNTVTLTVFWQNMINGEPIIMSVLRNGIPIIDTGLFAPLKKLLLEGKITPSPEAIMNAAGRVNAHMTRSRINLLNSMQELYLSMVDASHATLMAYDLSPPSPDYIPEMLEKINLGKRYIDFFKDMQKVFKKIEHRELGTISGENYDSALSKTKKFNNVLEKKMKKKL